MRFKSPLRYPGGKAKLADYVKSIFRANDLLDGTYAEPYAGGASVALTLLFEEYADRIYINDIDKAIYAFWHSVLYETEDMCRLVENTPLNSDEWRRQRRIYTTDGEQSLLKLGFATFYLNRTNRSGIIASGGMIGGLKQDGRWKLDARYNAQELVERIERIARYRDRISLSNLDAIDFMARAATQLPAKSLVYMDPPYFVKGRHRLYSNFYEEMDHADIAALLPIMPFRWLVSYDDAPAIRRLYKDHRRITYKLHYTAGPRQTGSEVMFFSDELVLPDEGPPNMKRKHVRPEFLVPSVVCRKRRRKLRLRHIRLGTR